MSSNIAVSKGETLYNTGPKADTDEFLTSLGSHLRHLLQKREFSIEIAASADVFIESLTSTNKDSNRREYGPLCAIEPYCTHQFELSRPSVFFLPSIHCLIRVVDDHIYAYDIFGDHGRVVTKRWRNSDHDESSDPNIQSDRIMTVTNVILPPHTSENLNQTMEHGLLFFTANGRFLLYRFWHDGRANDMTVVLQQRVGGELRNDASTKRKTESNMNKNIEARFFERKVVDNPRLAAFSDLWNEAFHRRTFTIPSTSSFLYGCDMLDEVNITQMASSSVSRTPDHVISVLSNLFTLSDPSFGDRKTGNAFSLELRKGEYVYKVVQHLPTRSILVLTSMRCTTTLDKDFVQNELLQLHISPINAKTALPSVKVRLSRIDLSEKSFFESAWQCLCQAKNKCQKAASFIRREKVDLKNSKKKKSSPGLTEPSNMAYEKDESLDISQPYFTPSLVTVYPNSITNSSSIHKKNPVTEIGITDCDIDNLRDYLYVLSGDIISIHEIVTAGWNKIPLNLANSYETSAPLQFRKLFSVHHKQELRSLPKSELVHLSDLISVSPWSFESSIPYEISETISSYRDDSVEPLFMVASVETVYFYGFYIDLKDSTSGSYSRNLPNLVPVLCKAGKRMKDISVRSPCDEEILAFTSTVESSALMTTGNSLSLNLMNDARFIPCASTSIFLSQEWLQLNRNHSPKTIIESLSTRNFFSSKAGAALFHSSLFLDEQGNHPYQLLLTPEHAFFRQQSSTSYSEHFSTMKSIHKLSESEVTEIFMKKLILLMKELPQASSSALDRFNHILLSIGLFDSNLQCISNKHEGSAEENTLIRAMNRLFDFQREIFCASFLSASSSVNVLLLHKSLHKYFSNENGSDSLKQINTPWTNLFRVNLNTSMLDIPTPAFLKCILFKVIRTLVPFSHLPVFHALHASDFVRANSFAKKVSNLADEPEIEFLPTLKSLNIEKAIEKLHHMKKSIRLFFECSCDEKSTSADRNFRLVELGEESLTLKTMSISSLAQITRNDISGIIFSVLSQIELCLRRNIQVLRCIRLIYLNINSSYQMWSHNFDIFDTKISFDVALVDFWRFLYSREHLSQENTASNPSTINARSLISAELGKITFGHLFFNETEQQWPIKEESTIVTSQCPRKSDFFYFFIKGFFTYISSIIVVELEKTTSIHIPITNDLREVRKNSQIIASQMLSFDLLLTKDQQIELDIIQHATEIQYFKLEMLNAYSESKNQVILSAEMELKKKCHDVAMSSGRGPKSDSMISFIHFFACIARLNDRLQVKYSEIPTTNYYLLWLSTWVDTWRKSYRIQEAYGMQSHSLLQSGEPLWYYITRHLLCDISRFLGITEKYDEEKHEDTESLLKRKESYSLELIEEECVNTLVRKKLRMYEKKEPSNGIKYQISDQVSSALREIFSVPAISSQPGMLFFKRLLRWVSEDIAVTFSLEYTFDQSFYDLVCQLRLNLFKDIFQGILRADRAIQGTFISECENVLWSNQDKLCDILVIFYHTFEKFHSVRIDRQVQALMSGASRKIQTTETQLQQYLLLLDRYSRTNLSLCSHDKAFIDLLAQLKIERMIFPYRLSLLQQASEILLDSPHQEDRKVYSDIREIIMITQVQLHLWELIYKILSDCENIFNIQSPPTELIWNSTVYPSTNFLLDAFYTLSTLSVFSQPSEYDSVSLVGIKYDAPSVNENFLGLLFLIASSIKGLNGEVILMWIISYFHPFKENFSKYSYWIRCRFRESVDVDRFIMALARDFLLGPSMNESKSSSPFSQAEVILKGGYILKEFHDTLIFEELMIPTVLILENFNNEPTQYYGSAISTIPFSLLKLGASDDLHSKKTTGFSPLSMFNCYLTLIQLKDRSLTGASGDQSRNKYSYTKCDEDTRNLLQECHHDQLLFSMISCLFIWCSEQKFIRSPSTELEAIRRAFRNGQMLFFRHLTSSHEVKSQIMDLAEIILNKSESALQDDI